MSEEVKSYDEVLTTLKETFDSFYLEAEQGASNKSAALKARKSSMQLRAALKEFRSASVKNDQANKRSRVVKEEVVAPVQQETVTEEVVSETQTDAPQSSE